MKALHLLMFAAASALPVFAAAEADAQHRMAGSSGPITPLSHGGHFRGSQIVPLSNGGHFRGGHIRRGRHGGHFGRGKFHGGKFHGGHFNNLILVEREVVRIVEVQVEAPPAVPPPPPPPPPARKPYVIGKSYASLPGGCMKLIEYGVSYYYCGGGEWYRLVGKQYKAVAKP